MKELSSRIFSILNPFSLDWNDSTKQFVILWIRFHRVRKGLKRRMILLRPRRIVSICQFVIFCQVLNCFILETLTWSKSLGFSSFMSLDRDHVIAWLSDGLPRYHFLNLDGHKVFVELDEFCGQRQDPFVRFERRIR